MSIFGLVYEENLLTFLGSSIDNVHLRPYLQEKYIKLE